jgi:hypothetical protein
MKYLLILLAVILLLFKFFYLDRDSSQVGPDFNGEEVPTNLNSPDSNSLEVETSEGPLINIEDTPAQEGSSQATKTQKPFEGSFNGPESSSVEGSPSLRGERSPEGSEFGSHLKTDSAPSEGSSAQGVIIGIKSDRGSDGSITNKTISDNGSPLYVKPNPDGTVDDGSSIDSNGSNLRPVKK